MRTSSKTILRTAMVASVVACGGQGGVAPFDDGLPAGLGFVGSGGGGGFEASVAGDGAPLDAANDGGGEPRDAHGGVADAQDDGAEIGETDGAPAHPENDAAPALDGSSSVGVTLTIPPGFFPSLGWAINGPAGHYSGTVTFGDAHSLEFVVGGIEEGTGYTLTLTGKDVYGDPCSGTSAPFAVLPGKVSGAGVTIDCATADATSATVTTGSVEVDAAVGH